MKMNENVLKHFAGIKKLNIFLLPPFFTDASTKRKYFVSKQGATRRKERAIIGAVNLWQIIFFEDIKTFFVTFFLGN